jgi:hypothetical protein
MSSQLLGPIQNDLDLIDFFIEDINKIIFVGNNQIIIRKLYLTTENSVKKIKGYISYQNLDLSGTIVETIHTKEQNRSYSEALITDQIFVGKMDFLWDSYSINLSRSVTLNLEGQEYLINKYVMISNKKIYLIENL